MSEGARKQYKMDMFKIFYGYRGGKQLSAKIIDIHREPPQMLSGGDMITLYAYLVEEDDIKILCKSSHSSKLGDVEKALPKIGEIITTRPYLVHEEFRYTPSEYMNIYWNVFKYEATNDPRRVRASS